MLGFTTTETRILACLERIADALDRGFPHQDPPMDPDWSTEPSVTAMTDAESWEHEQKEEKARLAR